VPPGAASPNRSLMIVLAYLWILAVIPLVVEKDDREVQWHAKHGLVLLVAEIILWVVVFILSSVIPFIGCVLWLAWIPILIIRILCIVKGVNGERFLIPALSDFADRF
jgi:uncharacterized membrane protein